MDGHHLILGELVDYITGEVIKDTHDERYRQNIAHRLVAQKGYVKTDIEPRKALVVKADNKKAVLKVDFMIHLAGQISMVVKYGALLMDDDEMLQFYCEIERDTLLRYIAVNA